MKIPKPIKIDGVNYVRRTIDVLGHPVQVEGLTVRALRKLLEKANQDGVVCYMAEQTEATRNCQLIIGVIAGAGCADNAAYLFGPEGVLAITAHLESQPEPPAQSGTVRLEGQNPNEQ